VSLAALELDLDVFSGPFDLLLTLILREEVDLLELPLAEVVLAYLDHLEAREQLDLEAASEFIVLIAALLELKSRLMLSGDEVQLLDIEPEQAAEELLERMLQARRYRAAASHLKALLGAEQGVRFRNVAPPAHLRRSIAAPPDGSQSAELLGQAMGRLLTPPPSIDVGHIAVPRVTLGERLEHLRGLLRRGRFSFEEAVGGADRMTVAVTLFALLELYKRGEARWHQRENFGEIAIEPAAGSGMAPASRAPQAHERAAAPLAGGRVAG
jgi:segregation and condensation protein A